MTNLGNEAQCAHMALRPAPLLTAGLLLMLPAGGAATDQQSASSSQQQPVFRAGVELVALNFMAVDKENRPVTDLKPSDLRLTVAGRERPIQTLQFVKLVTDDVAEGRVSGATRLPSPYATNNVNEIGRSIILLFHHESIRPGNDQQARDAAKRFVDTLAPYDRVALVTIPFGKIEVDLTMNHDRVKSALDYIAGHLTTAMPTVGPKLSWLVEFVQGLSAIEGPKTIVFISEGLPIAPDSPEDVADLRDVAKAAGAASAQFYVIKPNDFASDAGTASPASAEGAGFDRKLAGLQDLATITGGELFQLSGTADRVFTTINKESSAYYLLGFVPDDSERNAKSHRVNLACTRPGVTIRWQPEFTIPKPRPNSGLPPIQPTLPAVLRNSKAYRDLQLRALAYGARDPGTGTQGTRGATGARGTRGTTGAGGAPSPRPPASSKLVKVVVVAEAVTPGVKLTSASFVLVDDKGKVAQIWPADDKELARSPVVSGTTVAPGTYRLRVAATDADDRRGAVDYEFSAGLTPALPVQMSSLMLGDVAGDAFVPRLDFGGAATASGYVEVYGTLAKGTSLAVDFEIAGSADGPPIARTSMVLRRGAGSADRFIARGTLPIGSLMPGDFLARAVVKVNDQPIGRVTRTLRKSPTTPR